MTITVKPFIDYHRNLAVKYRHLNTDHDRLTINRNRMP